MSSKLYLSLHADLGCSLPIFVRDDKLEDELEDAFGEFGPCYAKVRRGHKRIPYSFVQFHVSSLNTKIRSSV